MYSIRNLRPCVRSLSTGARLASIRLTSQSVWKNAIQSPAALPRLTSARATSFRGYSVLTATPDAKIYKYDEVKQIASSPDKFPNTVLVDVREPVEFLDGHIPGAINVPFKSSPGALDLSEEEFQEHFGFAKPTDDKELVFYCLGGVRSAAAEELAATFGYNKRGNYIGSWEDWVEHENKSQ
ncbi:Rhodanese-like protein [Suhomyces tanzawaensis NRRL Y-17324]|uniref:Rhodanese-like protein n=1 Tax=Suhomyces tanzawaensis NRRL Y-17324 TaxID=984487 RepID=A0A1E4SKX3_9ASCO|nr:Rhodanese-like protein [Suhomyces tanzawaensis NRRL Y-17324]ODV80097.1 Rhodanese-like protein [Suhomyces tanzawaensis NRRL Y-17324]